MTGFLLLTGNRQEELAHKLAERIRTRPDDPFVPETIIIQSRGMERWLSLEIAHHNGVAANLRFPFPETFLQSVMAEVLPEIPDDTVFQKATVALSIFALLPGLASTNRNFEPIRHYLSNDGTGVKRFQLSEQIANLFDQYIVFRSKMILDWDAGRSDNDNRHESWQAILWRSLAASPSGPHRARLWHNLMRRLQKGVEWPPNLPHRVSVFGISYLPPLYLETLIALSNYISVDFYHLNPCQEYWSDIVDRSEEQRLRRPLRESSGTSANADLHMEEGNRLLASLGNQGRAFHHILGQFDTISEEVFHSVGNDTLLKAVQNDILNLRSGSVAGEGSLCQGLVNDRSIQLHACHSPMREIEVLYDQVLDLLNQDESLEPRHILVLMPDIETYAPYIQAVFGAPEDETLRIPFSVADRKPLIGRPAIEAFFQLLELKSSRFSASEILSLLEVPSLRAKFGLTDDDLRLIESWISDTRIRWGADAESKKRLGFPPTAENTWQAGLDRLLMGYAARPSSEDMMQGILPAGGAEGPDAEILGHLVSFVDQLTRWQSFLNQSLDLTAWSELLAMGLEDFFQATPADEPALQLLRRLVAGMRQAAGATGLTASVGVEVATSFLRQRLSEDTSGAGFISGGITFGALLPMRCIPARVICLVGMNQDIFPREDRPLGFDLMAANPRIGDRSRRNDDKYLFLEALISARDSLYVSYVGYQHQDNTVLPPSVLVSELMDYLTEGYGASEIELLTRHRLQAFSPAYFSSQDQQLFSYSRQSSRAARVHAERRPLAPPEDRITRLPEWDANFKRVDIDTLTKTLSHPCRFLLEQRLQLYLYDDGIERKDRESFSLDPLDAYALGQELMHAWRNQPSLQLAIDRARAAGRLPHGETGDQSYAAIYHETCDLVRVIKMVQAGEEPMTLAVEVFLDGFTITGRLDPIFPSGQLCYRYSRTTGADIIGAWVRHLLWCHMAEETGAHSTVLINRDDVRQFKKINNPQKILCSLLALYARALSEPVPFFPRSSWEFAVMRFEKAYPSKKALARVQANWLQSYYRPGEGSDPYIQHCFKNKDPLDDRFVDLTETVYQPLMDHVEKI